MAIPTFSDDVNIISKLPDNPVTDGGYTAETFKAAFDIAAGLIKTYINNVLIPELEVLVGDIQGSQIHNLAINTDKLADDAITRRTILNGEIVQGKLGPNSVVEVNIQDGSVTKDKIGPGEVYDVNLHDNAVVARTILNGEVTAAKLGSDVDYAAIGLASNQVRAIIFGTEEPTADILTPGQIYFQYTASDPEPES